MKEGGPAFTLMPCKGPLLASFWSAVECWSLTEPLPKPLRCLVPLMHTCSAFILPQISQLFSSHAELYILSLSTATYNAERACRKHKFKERTLAVHRDRRVAWEGQAADPRDGCAEVGKAGSVTGFTLRVLSTDVALSQLRTGFISWTWGLRTLSCTGCVSMPGTSRHCVGD